MGSYVVVLVRENDHFILCIKLSSKAKMKEANAERMSRHPPDSAALRSPVVSAPRVLLLVSQIMTVEVTKMSPAQPPAALEPLQTVCILLSRDVPADVMCASSTRLPALLSERVPRPPR